VSKNKTFQTLSKPLINNNMREANLRYGKKVYQPVQILSAQLLSS